MCLSYFSDETFPRSFLQLCGLQLPEQNSERTGGEGIIPGSDNEEEEDDGSEEEPEDILRRLNNLNIDAGADAADGEGGTFGNNLATNVSAADVKFSNATEYVPFGDGHIMRIIDFCQFGRTIGQGKLAQTRDMMTIQITLPGGIQINSIDATIAGPRALKFLWDYHPALYMSSHCAFGSLKQDTAFVDAYQARLNREWKLLADNNSGRLGETYEYKLKELPSGKSISLHEGFINPFTFNTPQNSDPCLVNKLTFNVLDNTSPAVVISLFVLVERERTQSVRRNRHRHIEETSAEIESLPTSLLPEIARLLDSPDSMAATWAGGIMPDLVDPDGTRRSPTSNLRRSSEARSSSRRVARRVNNSSPSQASILRRRQQQAASNQRHTQYDGPNIIQEDGQSSVPSLAELMNRNEEARVAGRAAAGEEPNRSQPSPMSVFFDADNEDYEDEGL